MCKAKSVFGIPYSILGNQYLISSIRYSVLGISPRASLRHPSQKYSGQSKIGIQYLVFDILYSFFYFRHSALVKEQALVTLIKKGKSLFGIGYFGILVKELALLKKVLDKKQNQFLFFKKSSALLSFPGSKT